MNIGEAAKQAGVSAKMIRHYEKIGLIGTAERRDNGYRSYSPPDIQTLRFIRHCRELDFPITQIRSLLSLWRDEHRSSAQVKDIAQQHLTNLEKKIADMQNVATMLQQLTQSCCGDHRPDCAILNRLAL